MKILISLYYQNLVFHLLLSKQTHPYCPGRTAGYPARIPVANGNAANENKKENHCTQIHCIRVDLLCVYETRFTVAHHSHSSRKLSCLFVCFGLFSTMISTNKCYE